MKHWNRWAPLIPIMLLLVAVAALAVDPARWQPTGDPNPLYSMFFRGPAGTAVPVSADDPLPTVGTFTANVSVSTITAELATGTNRIGSVDVDSLPALATGTNAIGLVGPAADSVGSATIGGRPARPFAAQLYLTDNASFQEWYTGLLMTEGQNGQNTAAVSPGCWNGAGWDRLPGSATSGLKTNETPLGSGSFTVLATGLIATEIASTANRCTISITNIATETVWIAPFGTTCSFPSGGIPLSAGDTWSGNLGAEAPVWYVSSTTGSIAVVQGVRQ